MNTNGAYRPLNFNIKNAADDTAVIDIDGFIGRDIFEEWMTGKPSPNTVENLKNKLREITAKKVIVNINSPGGDLNDGLVIMEMLQSKSAEVVTNIQGFSASAATVIGQAGTTRRMSENAFMLIHRVMFGFCGYLNQNTMYDMIQDAEVIDTQLIKMYRKQSSLKEDEIADLMDEGGGYGRWITAEDALEFGFIDEIYDPADESDEDVDRLEGEDVENMKRNVRELAIQGMKGSEEFVNAFFGKELQSGKVTEKKSNKVKELQEEADSAGEARTRNLIIKQKLEV